LSGIAAEVVRATGDECQGSTQRGASTIVCVRTPVRNHNDQTTRSGGPRQRLEYVSLALSAAVPQQHHGELGGIGTRSIDVQGMTG
jgi:hypothetical protein